jgi:hypothetical protein
MISDPALYRRGNRLLGAAILFSLIAHLFGIFSYLWVQGWVPWLKFTHERKEERVALSTSMVIRRITVPQLSYPNTPGQQGTKGVRVRPERPQQPQRPEQPQQPRRAQREVAATRPAFRELTKPTPRATPLPPSPQPLRPQLQSSQPSRLSPAESVAQMLARQQPMYEREVAQLQRRNNPLSVATISPRPASAFKRAYFNISGIDTKLNHYEGLVTPTRTWYEGSLRCHYADYDVEYAYGGTDKGSIPWPLCYHPDQDPMTLPDGSPAPSGTPVPARDLFPMAGYIRPAGLYLTPFLESLYERNAT